MLTETAIRKARTPPKPTKLSDERGLYLLCAPSGGKRWRFKFRYDGKKKLPSRGTFPALRDRSETTWRLSSAVMFSVGPCLRSNSGNSATRGISRPNTLVSSGSNAYIGA
ncbi:MAG: DUF4102 domain-containing protein [Alphaproteobacteria bacterium]|nr:DUF4102 domain-containing protein [Alphaproteobacteria bacterium]MBV8407723.1 DUF4102 domain-containing protein [Alphaproteobacteria bacterium]